MKNHSLNSNATNWLWECLVEIGQGRSLAVPLYLDTCALHYVVVQSPL